MIDARSRIVDAAARLLREHGPAAVTTRGVAEAAGVQAPTIYRLFGDKDGLLEAVAEHVMAGYVAVLRQILTDAPGRPDGGPMAATVAFRAVAPHLDVLSDAERQLLTEWLDRVVDAPLHISPAPGIG